VRWGSINIFCYFLPSLTILVPVVINEPTPPQKTQPSLRIQPRALGSGYRGCTDARRRAKEQLFAALLLHLGESTDAGAGCESVGALPGDAGL